MDIAYFNFLLEVIYVLSAVIHLIFGFVIFTLRRSARIIREKNWATPFALTFFVLAGLYSLRLFNLLIVERFNGGAGLLLPRLIEIIIATCSGFTNYLFLLSAFRLLDHAMGGRLILPVKRRLVGSVYTRGMSLALMCLAGLMQIGADSKFVGRWASVWFTVPDGLVSVLAICLMGFALYQNINVRRDRLIARIAWLSSVGYAALYLLYSLGAVGYFVRIVSNGDVGVGILANLLTFLLLLLLKVGIFFPGYALMLWSSGPLEAIDRFYENVTRMEKEYQYLESDGVVRSIREELQVESVGLYIKLPGTSDHQVAHYAYPPTQDNDQEPRTLVYEEGTVYDWVMKSGEPYISGRKHGFKGFIPRASAVAVPVLFHNSVIACLEAEIGEGRFTETDLGNLKRIATMISPAVQAYRETAALNKISHELARLQLGVVSYDPGHDVGQIANVIHDVISPLDVGISIDLGFARYRGICPHDGLAETLIDEAEDGEVIVVGAETTGRRFAASLKVSSERSAGQKAGEQVLGRFVFATDAAGKREGAPTLGTNPVFRRALSNLITDTLLDFIRGYLNQMIDRLGVRLSALQGAKVEEWLDVVEWTAREGGLLWAVVGCPEDENLLGGDDAVALIHELESPAQEERWESKADGVWLYSLDRPEVGGASHVIKKTLKEAQATLWLGVTRQGFGGELDYLSPWKYFLDHFCSIADAALSRILIKQKQRRQMAVVQGIAAATLTTGSFMHRFVNLARGLESASYVLGDMVTQGTLRADDDQKALLLSFRRTSEEVQRLLPKITSIYDRDLRQPCHLAEAIERALERVEALKRYDIPIVKKSPPEAVVNIPFDVAVNALAIVIDNATDAIRERLAEDREGEPGLIRIHVREKGNKFVCDVTDNGAGVPPAIQSTLFREVSKSVKRNSHGVGLLFSADLLRLYDGDITLTSPGPAPNTTFSIHFPKS
jgi:signal transduction histidine kinase